MQLSFLSYITSSLSPDEQNSASLSPKQLSEEVQREGEHVGMVILCRDGVERLEVAELERGGRLVHHVSRLLKLTGSSLLSLGTDQLSLGLAVGLCLSGKGTLHVSGETYILPVISSKLKKK